MNDTIIKLPHKIFVLSEEARRFFHCIAQAMRINGGDDVADDFEYLANMWFYDAEELIEQVPTAKDFIGKYIVESPCLPETMRELLSTNGVLKEGK